MCSWLAFDGFALRIGRWREGAHRQLRSTCVYGWHWHMNDLARPANRGGGDGNWTFCSLCWAHVVVGLRHLRSLVYILGNVLTHMLVSGGGWHEKCDIVNVH